MKAILYGFATGIVLGGLLVLLAVMAPPAHAQDGYSRNGDWNWDWSLGTGDPHKRWHRAYRRHYYQAPRDYGRDVRLYREEVEDRELRERERDDGSRFPICLDTKVEVIGTIHTSKEASMEMATKLWSQNVQFKYGSQFMSWELAAEPRADCAQADAMLTVTGRVSEAINGALGRDGVNTACRLVARPCRARMVNPDRGKEDDFGEGGRDRHQR